MATDDCLECSEWPEALSGARYAFALEPPASDMVHSLKYEGWEQLGEEMGQAVADALVDVVGDAPRPVIVPVPTTAGRLRQRGYNQAAVLAETVSRILGVRVEDALLRPSSERSQTSLDPGQRRDNVRDAFRLSPTARSVRGATVLLIDDVLTTGATAAAAAGVLHGGGASRVVVATFARAMSGRRRGR